MNPATVQGNEKMHKEMPVTVVRRAIETLNSLDAETAGHLSALAFVLIRVARADGRVRGAERRRMEEILIAATGIPAEHAVLVTEIACHRAQLADCASAYAISCGLRTRLNSAHRSSVLGLLEAVADADGDSSTVERREILQIATELGIDPAEVFDRGSVDGRQLTVDS